MSLGETDMVSKNNHQFYQQKHAERKQRWGIRKLSVGVASVLLGTTFMLYGNHAVLADTVPTTTPTGATVQTDSNVADHQGSEVPFRTTTNAEEKVVATNTQDTTQDKDKQTNANETTQDTTNVDKKDPEVTPTNDAKTPTTQKTTDVGNEVTPANDATTPATQQTTAKSARRLLVMKEASTSLPMSNQDIKLDSQPMLTEIINKPTDNWVYNNLKWYQDTSTEKVKEILQNHTANDESGRYYFAGVANYNEHYHAIYLLARSNNLNDNSLYVTILHTGLGKNIQEEVVAPGESKKVEYSGTTHTPIFTNYDGTSASIDLDGIEKGDNIYGMVVGFAYGHNTGIKGDPASMGNGFVMTPIPTKMTTTIHYIDQATGDEIAVPKSFEGVAYQKYTITGEAPTIDGYTLKKSPETTGYISPYKVGESYDFRLDKHVVIKQTVIDAQGLVRVTAYYDGEVLNNTTRYLGNKLNVNDRMSFISHGKWYTYINQITSTNDGIVYYYAKDGSEDKSEVRVHYIDVTGSKNSIFVPGDGEEVATDKISGKLGENYNYDVNLPTDYNLATNQANTVNGTYTIDHHDEYVYVVKKTSAELDPTVPATTKVDDPTKLTADEKKEVADKVTEANKDQFPAGTQVTIGNDGTATITYPDKSVDTIPGDKVVEGKSDAAKNEPKVPGDKVKVDDPNKLTEDEKSEVVKAVKDANKDENGKSTLPEGSKVTVGDNGDVTVTYPDGSKDTIPGDKVVEGKGTEGQTDADKNEPKVPGDKVKVDDPNKLTEDEKSDVEQAIKDANKDENGKSTLPEGSKVTVGDNGDVTVTYPDGSKDTIPGDKVVEGKGTEGQTDADKNEPKVPGDKVKVDDPTKLTDNEKSDVEQAIKDANKDENGKSTLPEGSKVTVGDNGDVTITYPDGSKDTIPGDQVIEGKSDADKNTPNVPGGDKVKVDDPTKLTDNEKNAVKDKVDEANSNLPDGTKVTVGDDGTTTITYPDGSTNTISGHDLVTGKTDADKYPLNPGQAVDVVDPNHLTQAEQDQVKEAIRTTNPTAPIATITVDTAGNVQVTFADGSTTTLQANLHKHVTEATTGSAMKPGVGTNGGQTKGATSTNQTATKQQAQQHLPQTGDQPATWAMLSGLGVAFLGLLGLKKKRED